MRNANGWSWLGAATLVLCVGCGKSNDPPPAQPFAPASGPAPAPAVVGPAAAVATPAATLSQPSPFALPCQTDAQCLTHRCNVGAGKCAWPCQSDGDCMPGNACIAPTCLPKLQ